MARPLSTLTLPSSTLAALTRAGYETLQDIATISPETLAQDLNISLPASQAIVALSQKPRTDGSLTQTAASMLAVSRKFPTRCAPVDKLLIGGLSRGQILEVSGPPGTPKEQLIIGLVTSFVEAGEEVLFVDTQNMTSPAALDKALGNYPSISTHYRKLIRQINIHTLPELMVFMHNLPSYLNDHPNTALLVLNSISFPFQCLPTLSTAAKSGLLERVKQILTKACASKRLSVVTTSQLATKLLNADGSAGNFDTGSRAILVPQLGPAYLPSGRSYRVIIIPETRTTGVVRIISSPSYHPGHGAPPQEGYVLDRPGGVMTRSS